MTGNLTNDQIVWVKNHRGASANASISPELHTLFDLASRAKSRSIKSGTTTKSPKKRKQFSHPPIIIFVGATDHITDKSLSKYRELLTGSFWSYSGTIISGGTTAGICGIAGDIQEAYPKRITTIGYLPATIPTTEQIDSRYKEIRKTHGKTFSSAEPLQYWTDILASGIAPAEVRLVGISGGAISAVEYRIALLLGAKVGIIEKSGRAADALVKDRDWNTSENLIVLPPDRATLMAFICSGTGFPRRKERENLAQHIHEEYRKMQLANPRTDPDNPSLHAWKDLDPVLKESNRNQADHIPVKLRETGYRLRKTKQANSRVVHFTPEEIEHLAELEHGRWNAERLLAGWKPGPAKDVAGKISPYIVPWRDLPDDVREWDRNTVRQLPEMLARMGYELTNSPGKQGGLPG